VYLALSVPAGNPFRMAASNRDDFSP